MFFRGLEKLKRDIVGKRIYVVGIGKNGKELINILHFSGIKVDGILDNNDRLNGHYYLGVEIANIQRINEKGIAYIITPNAPIRNELYMQLMNLGIKKDDIYAYYSCRDYDYVKNLDVHEYKEEISDLYRSCFGIDLDWETPRRYTEILNWEKLYGTDPIKTTLADKLLVRKWVSNNIGEKYIPKLYGAWKSSNAIDFSTLPTSFVLKTNNGSGRNIIVKNKYDMDKETSCKQLDEWLQENFFFNSFETQYRDIKPMIICEEYLEGVAESVCEYNIYCFHGKPKYIWCIRGSHRPECRASFYDTKWNKQEFSFGYPYDPVDEPKPKGLDEMLKLSEKLSKDFKHVRVDWNNLPDGRILFSEITFSSWSGLNRFNPDEWDYKFGDLI